MLQICRFSEIKREELLFLSTEHGKLSSPFDFYGIIASDIIPRWFKLVL
jgi:hypothetical protein